MDDLARSTRSSSLANFWVIMDMRRPLVPLGGSAAAAVVELCWGRAGPRG